MYDIFFLSYDEPMADRHWQALNQHLPAARRVHGIAGIHSAHQHCAKLSRTSHFFVIDADNQLLDYDLGFRVPPHDAAYVHLWYATNPLNQLCYGWGGVKLFPKKLVLNMVPDSLDMTTSFPLKIVAQTRSITHFNYAALETWRAAFREAVKLCLADGEEAAARLAVWCSTASGPFAADCIRGAQHGADYAREHQHDAAAIRRINDFSWLRQRFECQPV